MNLKLDATVLKDNILKPLSRLLDDCVLTIEDGKLEALAQVDSGAIIVYSSYPVDVPEGTKEKIIIKDISKLISVLNCVKGKELNMTIEEYSMKYDSDDFKFRFQTFEEGTVLEPKQLKKEKLNNFAFNTSTDLNASIFYDILKASSYIKDNKAKLYFYTKVIDGNKGLYCDITDKTITNSDSVTIKLSNDVEGDDINTPLICDSEHIRKMNISRSSRIKMYFNTKRGFTIFDFHDDHGKVRYVLPTLSK